MVKKVTHLDTQCTAPIEWLLWEATLIASMATCSSSIVSIVLRCICVYAFGLTTCLAAAPAKALVYSCHAKVGVRLGCAGLAKHMKLYASAKSYHNDVFVSLQL